MAAPRLLVEATAYYLRCVTDSEPTDGPPHQSRRLLIWKATGLAIAVGVVGIALVVVLWLLVTLTFSLIGSL